MASSISTIQQVARKFNKEYFGGSLKISKIEFSISNQMVSCLGQFGVKRGQYQYCKISAVIMPNAKEWRNTLLHELVHAWQYQTGQRLSHGDSFKNKASEIHRINPDMIISRVSTSREVNNAVNEKRDNLIQYMAVKNGKANFFRKLTVSDILALKRKRYEVSKTTNPAPVRHERSYSYFAANGTHKYYPFDKLREQADLSSFKSI